MGRRARKLFRSVDDDSEEGVETTESNGSRVVDVGESMYGRTQLSELKDVIGRRGVISDPFLNDEDGGNEGVIVFPRRVRVVTSWLPQSCNLKAVRGTPAQVKIVIMRSDDPYRVLWNVGNTEAQGSRRIHLRKAHDITAVEWLVRVYGWSRKHAEGCIRTIVLVRCWAHTIPNMSDMRLLVEPNRCEERLPTIPPRDTARTPLYRVPVVFRGPSRRHATALSVDIVKPPAEPVVVIADLEKLAVPSSQETQRSETVSAPTREKKASVPKQVAMHQNPEKLKQAWNAILATAVGELVYKPNWYVKQAMKIGYDAARRIVQVFIADGRLSEPLSIQKAVHRILVSTTRTDNRPSSNE